jgi:hypothetical protein
MERAANFLMPVCKKGAILAPLHTGKDVDAVAISHLLIFGW